MDFRLHPTFAVAHTRLPDGPLNSRSLNHMSIYRSSSQRPLDVLLLIALTTLFIAGCKKKPTEKPDTPTVVKLGVGGIKTMPLNERKIDAAKFVALSSDQTGIEFSNELQPQNMRKYLLNGAGIATGDYDNDGDVDIYAVSQDGPNRLFQQTAPWKFQDVTETAGQLDGANLKGTGAAFADVNNDGWLDLYVCNIDGHNMLFINQQDGTFQEQANQRGVDYQGASTMCSFADYDRDGDLDMYLVNNRIYSIVDEKRSIKLRLVDGQRQVHPDFKDQYFLLTDPTTGERKLQEGGQRDLLLQNDGQGNFTEVGQTAGISGFDMGLSATWWDYDNDGWMDLYVANDLKSPDHLYRNQGDGTFRDVIAETVGHTSWFSMGADAADINNDGLMDFMVSDMSSTTHYKQKTTMGEMGKSAWFLTMGQPRQFMRNSLYVNSASKRLHEAANLSGLDSTDWSWSVKFGDLDSDMLVDVFVTNGIGRNMNDSDSNLRFAQLVAKEQHEAAEAQLLEMPPLKEENLVYRNSANLSFQNMSADWGLNHLGVSQGASVVDLDRDGDLDILVNNMNEPLGVFRNDLNHNHNNLLVQLKGQINNRFGLNAKITLVLGDQRLTRFMTSARGFMSADEPTVHFGLGTNESVDQLTIDWPNGYRQSFNNIQANQLVTITEGTSGETKPIDIPAVKPLLTETIETGLQHRHRELPYDDFRNQPLLPNKLSQLGPGVAWGDVNNDGLDDCFVGGAASSVAALFIQTSPGKFQPSQRFLKDRSFEDMGAVFFDLDGDDDQDLYIGSGGYERPANDQFLADRMYLNDGTGKFTLAPSGTIPEYLASGSCVTAADFDRDGDLDLFVGTRLQPHQWPLPASSYLLENRDGKLVDASQDVAKCLTNIGLVTGSVWSDVDQDGWIDLLVSLEWGPIKLLKNVDGVLQDNTEMAGLSSQTGWWNSINSGDIDQDGDIDFVAMNFGLNTKYHADEQHPIVLYAGDFDGNGTMDLVESEYEGDTCYPIRGRSCSSAAMPFLQEKFPSFHQFALAELSQIYSPESLQQSTKYTANQLRSMVLLNDGTGKFTFQALPELAQIAPGFGTILEDINGDGDLDLVIAQNFLHPQPETGQMDGGMGLLLAGDGAGNFRSVAPNVSGISVAGQGMALTVADLNQDAAPDLLMSINDQNTITWLNQPTPANDRLAIRLRAEKGNRNGIGSRVKLITAAGKTRSFEVTAGGGYLSQSSPQIFATADAQDPITTIEVTWPDGSSQSVNELGTGRITIQKQ